MEQSSSRMLWILVGLFLAACIGFAGRTVYFVYQIRNGNISLDAPPSFGNLMSISKAFAQTPVSEEGNAVVIENAPMLGSKTAPITIVEFVDYSCPFSKKANETMRILASEYGNNIRYIVRNSPLADIHPDAPLAALAAQCAFTQDKFWPYNDKLYTNQSNLKKDVLLQLARESNLDMPSFERCLDARIFQSRVDEDVNTATKAGVVGTPTFFINGRRIPGAIPLEDFKTIIDNIKNTNK